MSFALTSHMTLQAAIRQYYIDSDAPVRLGLYGDQSYCNLMVIHDPKLKEILAKVGTAFEKANGNTFFNVQHKFTPTEATDSKSSGACDDQIDEDHGKQVQDIFVFVKADMAKQTGGKLALELTEVTRLVVKKGEDRSFMMEPHRAYELEVGISDKALIAAEKSGLVFRKYGGPQPTNEPAYILGVGQSSIF